jgi:hypothetical protein
VVDILVDVRGAPGPRGIFRHSRHIEEDSCCSILALYHPVQGVVIGFDVYI